ncbi:Zinc finger protein-like 1 [Geranomyces variabilis]|uniref:Zinc finger protein-like 1 n=1 Tax=Geranomyces variabilis TaxID=109894 RepID=A0AAD5TVW8_9FUNG|nr:Zinc finger protein-like 1 [Geranomyces variabilis]
MLTEHPQCIVRPYLKWLENSEFSYDCRICGTSLDNTHPALRLCCLDVFHLECLKKYAEHNSACPTCSAAVYPPPSNTTPTAQNVRKLLPQLASSNAPPPIPGKLSVNVAGLAYGSAPLSHNSISTPLSASAAARSSPLDTSHRHPPPLSARKQSHRDLADSDANKYGRRGDASEGLLSLLQRPCGVRLSLKRMVTILLIALVMLTVSTVSRLRYSLPPVKVER